MAVVNVWTWDHREDSSERKPHNFLRFETYSNFDHFYVNADLNVHCNDDLICKGVTFFKNKLDLILRMMLFIRNCNVEYILEAKRKSTAEGRRRRRKEHLNWPPARAA